MPSTNATEDSVPRLTDAQLFTLCTASLRDDRAVEAAGNSKGEYQRNAIKELIRLGLLAEVRASGSIPVWRHDEHNAPIGIRITGEGLKAIGADNERSTGSQLAARLVDKIETAGRNKAPCSRQSTSAAPPTSYREKKR
jgi:hypothetical protein